MEQNKNRTNRISLILTYNRTSPYVKNLLTRKWNIPRINQVFQLVFIGLPLQAFAKNKNLLDLLGSKNTVNGKVVRTNYKFEKTGYSSPCLIKSGNLRCK